MGRPREFEEEAVLTGAMEVFRRFGFGAVSIRDLETATGLKAGSLYNAYGDKDGVFQAAMAHYNQAVLLDRITEYAGEGAGLAGLRSLFLTLLHEPDEASLGCLITNSAIEFGGDRTLPPNVSAGLEILSDVLVKRLKACRRSGELASNQKPEIAATRLLVFYQGVLVLIRAGWDKAALEKMIRDEFVLLGVRR
jgi:TetR/AcrR family transcriptional repressor of nem operon